MPTKMTKLCDTTPSSGDTSRNLGLNFTFVSPHLSGTFPPLRSSSRPPRNEGRPSEKPTQNPLKLSTFAYQITFAQYSYHAVRGVRVAVVRVDDDLEHSAVPAGQALQPLAVLRLLRRRFGAADVSAGQGRDRGGDGEDEREPKCALGRHVASGMFTGGH